MSGGLRAGVAIADITPPVGLPLAGGPFGPARRVLHPLHAKALALQHGADHLLLIAADLLGFDAAYATAIRCAIAARGPAPVANILLTATHTHGAPATVDLGEWGRPDAGYLAQVQTALVEVAGRAWQALAPARLGAGQIACPGVGVNRTRSPQPVVDDRLCVIRVDDAAGRLAAVVVNVGCHPVNLHSTDSVTPDYPHYLDLGAPVLFTLGACGDVNPANFGPERSAARARETADRITDRARALLPQITTRPDAPVGAVTRAVELPLQDGPATTRRLTLTAFRLGEAGLVGVPGELFAAHGRAVAARGPWPVSFAVALANGCEGYFPTPDSYERRSYEAYEVPRRLGRQPFTPDCGERIASAMVAALTDLRKETGS